MDQPPATPASSRISEVLPLAQEYLSTILRSIGDAVIATDARGRITFMNAVAEALTGWSHDEARGQALVTVFRIVHESTRLVVDSPVDTVLREGNIVGLANHTVLIGKDGTETAIDDSAAPIRDTSGALAGVVLVFRDVTQKRGDEERRRFVSDASEALLSASLDYEGRLISVAQLAVPRFADWAAVDILEDGVLRRVATAHVDPAKVEAVKELQRRYPSDPEAPRGVFNVIRTGKAEMMTEIPRELLVAAALDAEHLAHILDLGLRSYICAPLVAHGRTLGAVSFVHAESNRLYRPADLEIAEDVAHRAALALDNARLYREANEARREAENAHERFRLLAEASPQIVWAVNASGNHEYLSPRWNEYTGQGPDEPMADRWVRAVHPDDLERCLAHWTAARQEERPWEMEYRLRRADGVYRWHLGRSIPILERDRVVRWYGVATDIDEQKRAIQSRDELLATVSHDLRNPLGVILLAAARLEAMSSAGFESEPLLKLAARIRRSADRMERLIADLLDISSIEAGHLSLQPSPQQASSLIGEALESARPLARDKGVRLGAGPELTGELVSADRGRILQVLSNILANAIKFTPEEGTVRVAAARRDDAIVFSVTDTGPGIAQAALPRVFDRFWQANQAARAGSGLGLAICRGIVERHGGAIWVESTFGAGTTVLFTLPLAPSA